MRLAGLAYCLTLLIASSLAISNYLTVSDQARLRDILTSGLNADDVGPIDHAVRGLAILGSEIPNKNAICEKLVQKLDNANTEALFHIGKASSVLECSLQLPSQTREKLEAALGSSNSVSELFFTAQALAAFGYGVDAPKVLKALNAALKKDDSIASLGQAFHIAALLDGDVSSVFGRIEDAIVQADQIDGKMLQFEGGLSVTALVISGTYNLAKTVGQTPPISKDQANKFAEYFISRKSVQTIKGAHLLLEVAAVYADNPFHVPVAITLASKAAVSQSEPKFLVKVTNILGKELNALSVVADSATRLLDDAVVLSQKQLTPKDDAFELDLMSSNPGKGVYRVALSAVAADESRLVGNLGAVVEVKVLTKIAIEDVEVGVADSDQSTAPKMKKITYPQRLDGAVEADVHQKLILKFLLRDPLSGEAVAVHQAFVRLTHVDSQQEIFFVAEHDSSSVYKFDLDLAAKAKDFLYQSGDYVLDLIVGDSVIENPTVWTITNLKLTFTATASAKTKSAQAGDMYRPKPEIIHMFRQPEKRPPSIVSNAFTLLAALPFGLFLILVPRAGIDFTSFSFSPSALAFHACLGGIFTLFMSFWFYLNMFQTLKLLAILALPTFITGNYMLTSIANKRKAAK